ncbi:phosphoribosylanthranilate isomerase [Benzoatithermus flavus]|uniref:N-(5'-phosphoribosyl)anthranilate isomerase n=1 Tax=Benzoatithermus flavus TaxID=3108223 RepID=A0ABU8XLB8_9PROT
MRTRVKICCITSPEALALAVRYGADALGLVGPMPSGTGIIDLDTARSLAAATPPPVASFLLSCATDPEALVEQARHVAPTAIQIVDAVAPEAYARLRRELPALKIVQVVHVTGERTIAEALDVARRVDALLLDSGVPDAPVKVLGGTGRVHDWEISRRIAQASPVPVFLAGGLTPENVTEAIRTVRPFGVDLCTGLRTEGRLDERKLAAFMRAVAAA